MHRTSTAPTRPLHAIPSATEHFSDVAAAIGDRTLLLFLDFDGTLAPIVAHSADAALDEPTHRTLRALASCTPVAIVSGRDRADVAERVNVSGVVFAGSHGLDIRGPNIAQQRGLEATDALKRAQERLATLPDLHPGVHLEPKAFGLAVHVRRMTSGSVDDVEWAVARVAADEPTLRMIQGKQVFELRPANPWHKGRALAWLRERLSPTRGSAVSMYIGDDVTDEDAFAALGPDDISIVVRGEDDARESLARFALQDPAEVSDFLQRLLRTLEQRP